MNISNIINKMLNEKLTYEEISFLVMGYVKGSISDDEMTLFIKNIYDNGLSIEELFYLTDIMIKSGSVLDFSDINKSIVDKHSTGGVGDKTSFIVAPIVASLGIAVPKMSGKGLGLTGGTIDKLESINGYNVNLTMDEFKKQINDIGISIISQTENMCIADKKIYALRDEKNLVDSIPLIASSIMSKKIASSSPNIVIDLKVGKGAFMKSIDSAIKLSELMIKIGKYYNRKVICVLTDMNYPLGRTIGNALEVKEVKEFFDGKYDERFKNLCFNLSAHMTSLALNISFDDALKKVEETYNNGNAKNKFYEWIEYQKGDINSIKDFSNKIAIKSTKSGYINNIDPIILATLCKDLGAGRIKKEDFIDYAVGIELYKSVGEKVERGEILGTIYYNKEIPEMMERFKSAFLIENEKVNIKDIIITVIK